MDSAPTATISAWTAGDTHVLVLRGEWEMANAEELRQHFASLGEHPTVVVDLRDVTYCDSTVLTEFVRFHRRAAAANRRFEILIGASDVRRLFQITHLDKLLEAPPGRLEEIDRVRSQP